MIRNVSSAIKTLPHESLVVTCNGQFISAHCAVGHPLHAGCAAVCRICRKYLRAQFKTGSAKAHKSVYLSKHEIDESTAPSVDPDYKPISQAPTLDEILDGFKKLKGVVPNTNPAEPAQPDKLPAQPGQKRKRTPKRYGCNRAPGEISAFFGFIDETQLRKEVEDSELLELIVDALKAKIRPGCLLCVPKPTGDKVELHTATRYDLAWIPVGVVPRNVTTHALDVFAEVKPTSKRVRAPFITKMRAVPGSRVFTAKDSKERDLRMQLRINQEL